MLKFFIPIALLTTALNAVPWEPHQRSGDALTKHEHLVTQSKANASEVKVVFLGDSITEMWASNGKKIWDEHYATRGAFNYGIGGDHTENVLWRIVHGEVDCLTPKLVVLMIGTNNIKVDSVADIAKAIGTILNALHSKLPNTKILLASILPRQGGTQYAELDIKVHEVNKLIRQFADNTRVHYLDLAVHFELSVGHEIAQLYMHDRVHITDLGYDVWYKAMEPQFKTFIL